MKQNDYLDAPFVDEVHMTMEPNNDSRIAKSDRLRVIEMQKAKIRLEAQKRRAAMIRNQEKKKDIESYNHEKMLKKSLHRKDDLLAAALMQKHTPFSKSAMINNPLAGFIPAEVMKQEGASAFDPDFNIYMAVPAQGFSNHIRQKDLHYKDFPLVDNVSTKGDFSGVLLSEKGSPDYSTMIINDAKNDFGGWFDDGLDWVKDKANAAAEAARNAFVDSEAEKRRATQEKIVTAMMFASLGLLIIKGVQLVRKKG